MTKDSETIRLLELLKGAEQVGMWRWRFSDAKRTFIFDTLTGEFSHIPLPGGGARKELALRSKSQKEHDYVYVAFYFPDKSRMKGYRYTLLGVHRIVASLDEVSRLMCKEAKEAALKEFGGRVISQITLDVNHADADKTNNFLYNLEWVTRKENDAHIRRAIELIAKLDKPGIPAVVRCGYDNALGGKLRTPIFMSAERNPEYFGEFISNRCSGRWYRGEPYAKYMSRQISAANLRVGTTHMTVYDEDGEPHFIRIVGRTVWQILADCYEVRAVTVIPEKL